VGILYVPAMDCILKNNEAKEQKKEIQICCYKLNLRITILEHCLVLTIVPEVYLYFEFVTEYYIGRGKDVIWNV